MCPPRTDFGTCCVILCCNLWEVRPTYRLSQWQCDSRYVGRTSQRLQQRITQHVPKSVRGGHTFQDRTSLARSCKPIKSLNTEISSSAIGQHLLHNQLCAQNYSDDKFSILAHGRTAFHLLTLEATYIKTSKPNLCKQKEFVYSLKISH